MKYEAFNRIRIRISFKVTIRSTLTCVSCVSFDSVVEHNVAAVAAAARAAVAPVA